MLRRFATLGVLLLSLSGVIPAAAAWAFQTQSADCCPMGRPCKTQGGPTAVASAAPSCCTAQPAPSRSTVTINVQSDRRFADSPIPDRAMEPAFEIPSSLPSVHDREYVATAPPININQRQVYLLTGRLRL